MRTCTYPNLSKSCSVARQGPIGAATSTHSGNDDDESTDDADDECAAEDDADEDDEDADDEEEDTGGNMECGCCCCVSAADSTSITSKTRQLDGTRSRYLIGSDTHCERFRTICSIDANANKHDEIDKNGNTFSPNITTQSKNIVGYSN
jgi:hypothetical protein